MPARFVHWTAAELAARLSHRLLRILRAACIDPASAPREARRAVVILLRPSPLARRLSLAFLILQLGYAIELALLGHLLAALLVAALPLACRAGARLGRGPQPAPQRLVLTAQGRVHLLAPDGVFEEVRVAPASLRLGPWLLLCLEGAAGRWRLLLGPDNVGSGPLAALRRRLVLVDPGAEAVAPGGAGLLRPEQGGNARRGVPE